MNVAADPPANTSPIDADTEREYGVWKKNTPFLYDFVSTTSLLWPAITVQFLPDLEQQKPESNEVHDLVYQRLLVGSFSLGNGVDTISIYQIPHYRLFRNLNVDKLNYNHDKQEFELSKVVKKNVVQQQKINHHGDVNKLRYMPQNADVIASANNMGDLVIYDRTKHSNVKNALAAEINQPQLRLRNSTSASVSDIYAVDWNRQQEGTIVSGDMAGEINFYNIKRDFKLKTNTHIEPSMSYLNHGVGINDIEWVPDHDSVFVAGDDSGAFKLYDVRQASCVVQHQQSSGAVNSVSIHPSNSFCLATGDEMGSINVWDIRNFGTNNSGSVFQIDAHNDSITQVKWHPKFINVLGSSSTDKLMKIYDIGHNDLVFVHRGHMLGVNDFDWSLHDDWMVTSVSDDNSLHLWKPAASIVKGIGC